MVANQGMHWAMHGVDEMHSFPLKVLDLHWRAIIVTKVDKIYCLRGIRQGPQDVALWPRFGPRALCLTSVVKIVHFYYQFT